MIMAAWLMGKVMRYIALERRATIGASAELALLDRHARALLRLPYGPAHKIPDSPATSPPSGYDAKAVRMITFVPNPSAVRSTMRQAPDVLLRSVAIANHRLKTAATIGRRNGS